MKRLFSFLFVLSLSLSLHGQNDRFSTFGEMVGRTVSFYDAQEHLKEYGKFLFVKNEKGKLVALKEAIAFRALSNGHGMKASQVVTIKDKQYLQCEDGGETLFFLISEKFPILQYFRSVTCWENELEKLNRICPYKSVTDKGRYADKDVVLGKFVKVDWVKCELPKTIGGDVFFTYRHGSETTRLPYRAINVADFVTGQEVQREKERQEEEARQRAEQARRDSIDDYRLIVAYEKYPAADRDEAMDSLLLYVYYVYGIIGNKALAYNGGDRVISLDSLRFEDSSRRDFLVRRNDSGLHIRRRLAEEADSARIANIDHYIDGLREQRDRAVESFFNLLNSRQIFIMKDLYSYSDYQFGKRVRLYNCFGKRIKYVNITFTNYNGVGDLQRDDFGRTSAKAQGIGPIEKGAFAEYDWDELFWDDRDLIRETRITAISFTFFDGTTKAYTGTANIDKHRAGNCYEDDED